MRRSQQPTIQDTIKQLSQIQDPAEREKQLLAFINPKLQVLCNQCGIFFDEDDIALTVSKTWGYDSIGKDMDHDGWSLCHICYHNLLLALPLLCAMCKRDIKDVTIELMSRNENSSFHQDVESARQAMEQGHRHLEYCEVAGRPICELCYDNLTDAFKVPMTGVQLLVGTGDIIGGDDATHRKGRTVRGLQRWRDFEEHVDDA